MDRPHRLSTEDIEAQLQQGASQWARLARLSPAQRLARLRDSESLRHWGLLRHALDACAQAGKTSPLEAVDIAHFAVALAASLEAEVYGADYVHDFRTRALTALANAKRAAADFAGAEEGFRAAWDSLAEGTGDPWERAHLICHHALLLRDLGWFEEAAARLDEALALYEREGDEHLCARVLIQQAGAIGFVDPLRGIDLARRGLARLDPAKNDQYLELSGRNMLAYFLNDAGYPEEASRLQELQRPLYAKFPGVSVQSNMRWLDGLIARNRGDFAAAERAFRDLRDVLARHGFDLELVLVSLDLAELLLWTRRHAEAAELVRETYPVLVNWGLEKDVLALWLRVEGCLRSQADESTSLMRDLAASLRRGWNRRREAPAADVSMG